MHNVDLTPIKTVHNGYLFKSKLEAKWAVFFGLIGIRYQYEPEAFAVGNGWYTPDFYLPDVYLRYDKKPGVYLEIKPEHWQYDDSYVKKISSAMTGANLVLFNGEPYDFCDYGPDGGYQLLPYWDNCMTLFYCCDCNVMKIEFSESNYMECPHCNGGRHKDVLSSAAIAARQFHFKH